MDNINELLINVQKLKNLMMSQATGGKENEQEFSKLLKYIIQETEGADLSSLVPNIVRTNSTLHSFQSFIKNKCETYRERRDYIEKEFLPLINELESDSKPSENIFLKKIDKIDQNHIKTIWKKAIDEIESDPDGAITSARTLIETVCKHILDDMDAEYEDDLAFSKLYKKTANVLNLGPSQYTEKTFKQILSGCYSVIEGIGTLRNQLGDAHGKGQHFTGPRSIDAELAVNLSCALADYLLSTWKLKHIDKTYTY